MRKNLSWSLSTLALALSACVAKVSLDDSEVQPYDDEVELKQTSAEVVEGKLTVQRQEVGRINGCTATLITQQYILTAAHCVFFEPRRTNAGSFTIGTQSFPIQWIDSLDWYGVNPDGSTGGGPYDIALGRLTSAVPVSVARATPIASQQPPVGTNVTMMGFGCTKREGQTGGGSRRFKSFPWGVQPPTRFLCSGDSGGPVFLGGETERGAIIAVNSAESGDNGDDVFADVTVLKGVIEQAIRNADSTYEPNLDRPGFDYNNFIVATQDACRSACFNDPSCRAFSMTRDAKRCFLKSAVADGVPNVNVVSGLAPATAATRDFPGSDFQQISGLNETQCRQRCAANVNCKAYTKAGATCFLKNGVASGQACNVSPCTSGVHRGLEVNTNRWGFDFASVVVSSARACADTCARDDRCMAFTFETGNGKCWLKDSVPSPGAGSGLVSGVRRGWEVNVDRYGFDFLELNIEGPRPELCQAACARTSGCQSWALTTGAWHGAVEQLGLNRCHLKNNIPTKTTGVYGVISGVNGDAFF